MTKDEAHRLLDLARAGGAVSGLGIMTALSITGDLQSESQMFSRCPVDNLLYLRHSAGNGTYHLDRLFATASPARKPDDALIPAGDPPLPRNPGRSVLDGLVA